MADRDADYAPIGDYAIIGDCASAALVSRTGSIDWLCWPKFDDPSIFGALLDARRGGCFRIRPAGPFEAERRYIENTNAVETTFRTPSGTLRLTDAMVLTSDPIDATEHGLDHEIIREIRCDAGEVTVEILFDPRFDYGRTRPAPEAHGEHGYAYDDGGHALTLRSEIPLDAAEGPLTGTATLKPGDRRYLSLTYDVEDLAARPLGAARERLDGTLSFWQGWLDVCCYDGPYQAAVARSVLVLKLLTYARTGAILAAATTSLPEVIGGVRNWDYRYCWVRDAAFTLRALYELGYEREGSAFICWLMEAIGGPDQELQVLYDIHGTHDLGEKELDHLDGYRGSRPVRIGNGAEGQFQLDMYGEILSAAYEFVKQNEGLTDGQQELLCRLGETICKRWPEKDNGIWEIRGGRDHHTFSKVMCWVGLDRMLKLYDDGLIQDIPAERFAKNRQMLRDEIEAKGYNEEIGSYVSLFGGEHLDASLLLLPIYGYCDARAPRMRATFDRIVERLGTGTLLYRYDLDDGLPGQEGAFGICSFWDVEVLCHQGRLDEARSNFESDLSYANDVGLFAEEIDPETGALLGNFPQAFTHVGLINAALSLEQAAGRRTPTEGTEAHAPAPTGVTK